jgi:uncharacterized membrane protein YkgB
MDSVFVLAQRSASLLLRLSLGLVLLWIAALKFADPAPVRGLLAASLPFLASNAFVYAVGVLEITAAILLFAGLWLRYVGLCVLVLFGGTLTIFLIAPMLTYGPHGFPLLSLLGQFLLKDTVLAAAAINLVALDSARQRTRHMQRAAATSKAMAS